MQKTLTHTLLVATMLLLTACADTVVPALQEPQAGMADMGLADLPRGEDMVPVDMGADLRLEDVPGLDVAPEMGADMGPVDMEAEDMGMDAPPDLPTPEPDMTPEDEEEPTPDPIEACPRIQVQNTGGIGLNVRPDPSTNQPARGNIPEGGFADVLDIVQGQVIEGDTTWYHVRRGDLEGFVSGVWAVCMDRPTPGETDDVFLLPFPCGETFSVTQGNNSQFSHNGRSAWAYDLSMGVGTPMLAMKPGTVSYTYNQTMPGDPCYDGGGRECINAANYVAVAHEDGTQTMYLHLSRVDVAPGAVVAQGQTLGASGSTGWSTGPHAHVERQQSCGRAFCQSISMTFADVDGDGIPTSGQSVTSQNGCDN